MPQESVPFIANVPCSMCPIIQQNKGCSEALSSVYNERKPCWIIPPLFVVTELIALLYIFVTTQKKKSVLIMLYQSKSVVQ
jgi:hypothetical protein